MQMETIERKSRSLRAGRAFGASIGVAAMVVAAGCGARDLNGVSAQPAGFSATAAPQPNGTPVLVSCEPNQRTLVRPVIVNGVTLSQVECVTNTEAPVAAQPVAFQQPAAFQPQAR